MTESQSHNRNLPCRDEAPGRFFPLLRIGQLHAGEFTQLTQFGLMISTPSATAAARGHRRCRGPSWRPDALRSGKPWHRNRRGPRAAGFRWRPRNAGTARSWQPSRGILAISASLSCGPGKTNRYCWPLLISVTEKSSRSPRRWWTSGSEHSRARQAGAADRRCSANRVDRNDIPAQSLDDAGHVDPATARIAQLRRAS